MNAHAPHFAPDDDGDDDDLNAVERAIDDYCDPVALDEPTSSRLAKLKIAWTDDLYVAPVLFEGERFAFARDTGMDRATWSRAVVAVLVPVRDQFGAAFDLVASNLGIGAAATWRGEATMLGEWLLGPWRLGDGLHVYPGIVEWLRAERDGLVILNAKEARWSLIDEELIVDDAAFGRRLFEALSLPQPKVFVNKGKAA